MLEEIMKSEKYVTLGATYREPSYYISLFSNCISNGTITAEARNPVVVTGVMDDEHIAYPRYKVEARTNDLEIEGKSYSHVVGMLVALDLQKPMIKVYSGFNTSACLNLSIFNAEDIYEEGVLSSTQRVFDIVKSFSDNADERIDNYSRIIETLERRKVHRESVSHILGCMLMDSFKNKNGIPTSAIVGASKYFNDRKSIYYFEEKTNAMNIIGALTQPLTDSPDIFTKPSKTLSICNYINNEFQEN